MKENEGRPVREAHEGQQQDAQEERTATKVVEAHNCIAEALAPEARLFEAPGVVVCGDVALNPSGHTRCVRLEFPDHVVGANNRRWRRLEKDCNYCGAADCGGDHRDQVEADRAALPWMEAERGA